MSPKGGSPLLLRRSWLVCAALILSSAAEGALPHAVADAPTLDAAVLKKVKAATVQLQVKLANDRLVQGSGFFTDEPGLIITNAHVLSMMDADSRKPAKVEVVLTDADGKSRTVAGKVLGADRGTDLAVIRIEDKAPAEALKLGTTKDLKETDVVYVFGYPFGKELGKEITVSKSSVSSLRKQGSAIDRVQLDGGLNPGNSGGPVIDGKGNVIGVSVSGVRGSSIGFAIPAEHVLKFLNGRIITITTETPYYGDGKQVMLPTVFELIDPLTRLKKVQFDVWVAAPPPPPGNKDAPPAAEPPKKRFTLAYDAKRTSPGFDVPVPPLEDPKHVYYIRPVLTDGLGQVRAFAPITRRVVSAVERKPITLKYRPAPNGKQTAEMVSNGSFRIRTEDGEENAVAMDFRTAFTELFGAAEPKFIPLRLTYDRFSLTVKVDDKVVPGGDLNRSLSDIRFLAANVEMDKDGSVSQARPDLTKVPRPSQALLKDLCDQMLQSLELMAIPLPDKQVEAKQTWKAQRNFLIGSAILAVPAQGDLVYTYLGTQPRDGKETAVISIKGTVKGRRGDNLDITGNVNGLAYVLPETGEVVQANASVKAELELMFAKKPGKAIGMLGVTIKRPAPPPDVKK
jgi:hypothetical protein